VNSKAIQHNLDWVWPYWVERQFNPRDLSFVPRAFSFSHVNLTHRNWTAVGLPELPVFPIVDPRGLVTPLHRWLVAGRLGAGDDGRCLLPSRAKAGRQWQDMDNGVRIHTATEADGLSLDSSAWVELESGIPVCKLRLRARADTRATLILSLRPNNPEGVSFINELRLGEARDRWLIDGAREVRFSRPAARHHVSDYRNGDVHIHLRDRDDQDHGRCDVGMVTAAALFPFEAGEQGEIIASIPLASAPLPALAADDWHTEHSGRCRLECPEPHYQFLYDAAVTSLILHSPGDVYPGPVYLQAILVSRCCVYHSRLAVRRPGGACRARA
jgi:hypothetical protein